MRVIAGIDPRDFSEAGWGAIFADPTDPALMEVMKPLLALRHEQAMERFRVYTDSAGFRTGKDTKSAFLARHGAGPGPVDPDRTPYYMLIVGSPEQIPYRFQAQLDVQFAVGRIHFERLDEYAAYAESVRRAEQEPKRRKRRMVVFGATHPDDVHTQITNEVLALPMVRSLEKSYSDLQLDTSLGPEATKSHLLHLLQDDLPPSLLLTVSHGLAFPPTDVHYRDAHGAILCADWPGPRHWATDPLPSDFYFSAADVDDSVRLEGMIALHYSSYSAGTAQEHAYQRLPRTTPEVVPLVSPLAQRLLAHPQGGALAVIGFVDQVMGYSSLSSVAQDQTFILESVLRRLLDGYPVGSAMEYINERYAELATQLSSELEDIRFGNPTDPSSLADLWTANSDTRSLVVVGDPAVRVTGSQPVP